jgi:glyoxylase I family protein
MPIVVDNLTPLLQVFDMRASLAFYRDVLGFEVEAQSEAGDDFDWGLFRLGPATLMLNTAYERDKRPAEPDASRRAAHEDTALFFYCPDVDAVFRLLTECGVTVKPPVTTRYGMRQLYLSDPDGYVLCFQHRVDSRHGA